LGGTTPASTTVAFAGTSILNGQSLLDIRKSSTFVSPHSADLLARNSTVDLLLDPGTFLPTALTFATHPDADANRQIPVTVQFSDYRTISGVSIPFHIQKFMNGTLMLDVTVSSATIQ